MRPIFLKEDSVLEVLVNDSVNSVKRLEVLGDVGWYLDCDGECREVVHDAMTMLPVEKSKIYNFTIRCHVLADSLLEQSMYLMWRIKMNGVTDSSRQLYTEIRQLKERGKMRFLETDSLLQRYKEDNDITEQDIKDLLRKKSKIK